MPASQPDCPPLRPAWPFNTTLSSPGTLIPSLLLLGACLLAGVFTVSGIIDATVYHGQQAIKKKLDLGKLS